MDKEYFLNYLNEYNQTWVDKDLKKLKQYYDTNNNRLIYYDNHKNNDTYVHVHCSFEPDK